MIKKLIISIALALFTVSGMNLSAQEAEEKTAQNALIDAVQLYNNRDYKEAKKVLTFLGCQPGHALVAEHGEGGGANGGVGTDGNVNQHVARRHRVKANVLHLADGHAFVAHSSLGREATDAFLARQLVQ